MRPIVSVTPGGAKGKRAPGVTDHGYNAYAKGCCRCVVCREAKRAYMAGRRAAGYVLPSPPRIGTWMGRPILDVPTHGVTGYRRGCRCPECTEAAVRYWHRRRGA